MPDATLLSQVLGAASDLSDPQRESLLRQLLDDHLTPLLRGTRTVADITADQAGWLKRVADVDQLAAAGMTAAVWDDHPAHPRGRAAEIVIRLIYGVEPRAQQAFTLWASARSRPVMARTFYDSQRAETGYEGDDRVTLEPTVAQIADCIRIVRVAAGE